MKERTKAGLVLALMLAASAGWWFFFHTPMRVATAGWQAESTKAHATLIDVQNYKNSSAAARQAEQKKRHAFLEEALPETMEQSTFLGSIERLAFAHHLMLLGVKPGETLGRADGLQECSVTVKVAGDYFQLIEFLQGLDAQKAGGRFVNVRELSLKAGKPGEPLTATLVLSVFAAGKDITQEK